MKASHEEITGKLHSLPVDEYWKWLEEEATYPIPVAFLWTARATPEWVELFARYGCTCRDADAYEGAETTVIMLPEGATKRMIFPRSQYHDKYRIVLGNLEIIQIVFQQDGPCNIQAQIRNGDDTGLRSS